MLCESVFALARGGELVTTYVGACALPVVGGSLGFGLVAALVRLPTTLALIAWVATAGWLLHGVLALPVLALAAAVGAWLVRRAPPHAVVQGLLAGGVLSLSSLLAPWLTVVIAAGKLTPGQAALARHAVVFGALSLGLAWLASRPFARRSVAMTSLATLAVLLALAASPLAWRASSRVDAAPLTASSPSGAPRENVLLIVLDTVRADHTSLYGYERETTPELARWLARRPGAVRYQQAYSNSSWTVPAHATLLTGQLPSVHGADYSGQKKEATFGLGLFPDVPSLVEGMRANGRATFAVFANPWLREARGLSRGFQSYEWIGPNATLQPLGERVRALVAPSLRAEDVKPYAGGERVSARLLERLADAGEGPFFGLVNFMDAHGPHIALDGVAGKFGPTSVFDPTTPVMLANDADRNLRLMARYDEQILRLDARVGELFGELERLGRLDDTWVIVLGDHGEAFGEHGVTDHGTAVFEELVRVPQLIFPPRGATLPSTGGPVSQLDVAATLAALTGVEYRGPGRDLRTLDADGPVRVQHGAAPFRVARHGALAGRDMRAVVRWPWKLVLLGDEARLYDLATDPGETRDLAAERRELVQELTPLLPERMLRSAPLQPASGGDPGNAGEPAANADLLNQLGY